MKKRFITSIYIVLVSVLAILSKLLPYSIGDYIFDIYVLFITIVAGFEICKIMEANNRSVNKFLATMYGIVNYITLLFCLNKVAFYNILLIEVGILLLYWLFDFIYELLKYKDKSTKQNFLTSLNTLLACIYPSFLFCLLLNLNHADMFYVGVKYFSLMFIVIIFAITWLTDTCAYIVGCSLKGPKLAPKISPNKTISGACGGLIGGVIGAMLVYLLLAVIPALTPILTIFNLHWWNFLLIGLFGSVFGQMGDLFESKLKRNAGVKDSSNIFPGHGGMLDRIDAMIFISTFVYLVILAILS